ncbi:post-transcriptional regulator [Spiroplasma alleghenense]|uniref:Uncharacterized protein n=1 Tax=Spiroplasma alleghenense TaxID=216931 RepID=A0A345Z3E2_9MOLU|nr:post-transcriptional regulator [Spiroplasma alleghenense]AXK51121.1 hypothetical protein SALLE_v1c04470 [Spiroplasma alleghenense]
MINPENKTVLENYVLAMLEIKTIELRHKIYNISIIEVLDYLRNFVLKGRKIKSISEASYFIFNIKINYLMEYLNIKEYTRQGDSLENDLKSILEG